MWYSQNRNRSLQDVVCSTCVSKVQAPRVKSLTCDLTANISNFKLGLAQFYYAIDWSEVRKGCNNENKMKLWMLMQLYISRRAHCSHLFSFHVEFIVSCPYSWTCKYQNSLYQMITHAFTMGPTDLWLTLLVVTCLFPCKCALKWN